MKKSILFAAMTAMILCSCGTSKKMSQTPIFEQQPTSVIIPSANPAAQNQIAKQEIALNDCEKAELEENEYMRAAASGTSYDKSEAKMIAEENARTALATRIQTAVDNATKSYNKNTSTEKALSESRIRQRINKQFCSEIVGGLKVVATNIYAMPNGTIEYNVCYEMKKSSNDVIKNVLDEVSSDEELKILFDQKNFEEEMKDEFNDYKENRKK